MSSYLGFSLADNPNFYFVSYNNEDAERVGLIAQRLSHNNIPLWYDYGIEYGENWETKISSKLANSQAVLLFFTKGTLYKENSYVRKEYTMATQYFNKKVYIIMMDDIDKKEIPFDKVPWWIDIQERQCINIVGINDFSVILNEISKAIGLSTHEDKMNQIIKTYRDLYDVGKSEEAESYLSEYLKGKSLLGKAKCVADIYSGKFEGATLKSCAKNISKLDLPLINHVGDKVSTFFECHQLKVDNTLFTFGNSMVFHRWGGRGDAHVINIWKDSENIHTIGGLIEARNLEIYYDHLENVIYLIYESDQERIEDGEVISDAFISVTTIEDPSGRAICNDFRYLIDV